MTKNIKWYLFSAGSTPEGQLALGDEAAFRQGFQAGVGKARVVAVFGAAHPGDVLELYRVAESLNGRNLEDTKKN